jgi:hypothetical protein
MTDDERAKEAAEEQIEDLEAPAEQQGDVAGGAGKCAPPTKRQMCDPAPHNTRQGCVQPSCGATMVFEQ